MATQDVKENKFVVSLALIGSYVVSIFTALMGFAQFTEPNILAGIYLILAGVVIYPSTGRLLESRYSLEITRGVKIAVYVLLFGFALTAV